MHNFFNTKPPVDLLIWLVLMNSKTKYRLWVHKNGNFLPEVKTHNTTQGTIENFGS